MVEPIFKERNALEIETGTEMEKRSRRLLFEHNCRGLKSFNVMYLKGARNVAEAYTGSFILKDYCDALEEIPR